MQERKSKQKNDLTGKTFTYLTPLYYIKGGKWHCKCKCGKELDVDTRNLNSGHTQSCGCLQKEKASKNAIDISHFENEGIIVLQQVQSNNKGFAQWKCLCKLCGNIFITLGKSIRANQVHSCGCSHSKNEQLISKILSDNNIEFATEYVFPDLVGINGGHLRFDFAVFNNHKLSHLIEYNGLQHYIQPQGSWGDNFITLQQHDKIKMEYCKKHNIPLKIIRYDQKYTLSDLI